MADLYQLYRRTKLYDNPSLIISSSISAFNAALQCNNLHLASMILHDISLLPKRNIRLEFASYRCLGAFIRRNTSLHNKSPLLSVIIPGFNCHSTIQSCINSLLQMDSSLFEIIYIDDGSSDDSYALVKDIKCPNLIAFNAPASGNSGTPRNIGLGIARGKYIGFIDSDDSIDPNYFEHLLETIQLHHSDIVQCQAFTKISSGKKAMVRYKYLEKFSGELPYCSSYVIWDKVYNFDFIKKSSALFSSSKIGADTLFLTLLFSQKPNLIFKCLPAHYNYTAFAENSVSKIHRKKAALEIEDKPYNEFYNIVESSSLAISDDFDLVFWLRRILSMMYCLTSGSQGNEISEKNINYIRDLYANEKIPFNSLYKQLVKFNLNEERKRVELFESLCRNDLN